MADRQFLQLVASSTTRFQPNRPHTFPKDLVKGNPLIPPTLVPTKGQQLETSPITDSKKTQKLGTMPQPSH